MPEIEERYAQYGVSEETLPKLRPTLRRVLRDGTTELSLILRVLEPFGIEEQEAVEALGGVIGTTFAGVVVAQIHASKLGALAALDFITSLDAPADRDFEDSEPNNRSSS